MKKFILDFVKRGLMVASAGPLVLAVIYYILEAAGAAAAITPSEAALGIVSLTLLAFLAGGIGAIYGIDRLAPAPAALIHGAVLYAGHLIVYLLNDWIPRNPAAVGVFSAIFAAGYSVIWLIIWRVVRARTDSINQKLKRGRSAG